jgi:hypothetical protein
MFFRFRRTLGSNLTSSSRNCKLICLETIARFSKPKRSTLPPGLPVPLPFSLFDIVANACQCANVHLHSFWRCWIFFPCGCGKIKSLQIQCFLYVTCEALTIYVHNEKRRSDKYNKFIVNWFHGDWNLQLLLSHLGIKLMYCSRFWMYSSFKSITKHTYINYEIIEFLNYPM